MITRCVLWTRVNKKIERVVFVDRIFLFACAHTWRCTARNLLATVDRNTSEIDDVQPIAHSAHSRLRSLFGCIAERASLTGCEPKAQEQFEDFASHSFASIEVIL